MRRGRKPSTISAPKSVVLLLRMHHGLSQQQLADRCGVCALDISRIERGQFGLQIWKFRRLAQFFGLSMDALVNNRFDQVVPMLSAIPETNEAAKQACRRAWERQADVGYRGEQLAAQWEREKLAGTGYENGVDANFAMDISRGFDIFSFTLAGAPLYVEVKTTVDKRNIPFVMSAGEKAYMEHCYRERIPYELHRIYDLEGTPKLKIYTPKELMTLCFAPTAFLVSGEDAA